MSRGKWYAYNSHGPSYTRDLCFSSTTNDLPSPQSRAYEETEQPPPKRKKSTREDVDSAILLHLQEKAESRIERHELTEDDHFGRHVAGILKRLNHRSKAAARIRIEQVLLDCEFLEPTSYGQRTSCFTYTQ